MLEATIPTLMSITNLIMVSMTISLVFSFYLYTKSKRLARMDNNGSEVDHHNQLVHGDDDVDRVVCLSKLSADQTFRVLKACNHGFHAHCIDAWLKFRTTCPLRRTNIPACSSEHEGGLFSWSISLVTSISKWMENISLDDELAMAVCANFSSLP